MVLELAKAELKRVLLACVQAKLSFGHRFKRGQDAATRRAGDTLTIEVNVVSAVALFRDNLLKWRLERRREQLLEGVKETLVKRGKITFQF